LVFYQYYVDEIESLLFVRNLKSNTLGEKMSLKKVIKDENGGRAKYVSHGDFEKLIFFCPDIRYDYLKKGTKDEFISKTPEELENELKNYLISLSIASFEFFPSIKNT